MGPLLPMDPEVPEYKQRNKTSRMPFKRQSSKLCLQMSRYVCQKDNNTGQAHRHPANSQSLTSPGDNLCQNPKLDETVRCLKSYILCSVRHFHPIISEVIASNQTPFFSSFALVNILHKSEVKVVIQMFSGSSAQLHVNMNLSAGNT